jgi:hypothetical protein
VRLLIGLLISLSLAAGLGLWSTWIALESPPALGAISAGPWIAAPERGGLDSNPYDRAVIARNGEAPLLASDALVFTAIRDSDGRRLRGACDYTVEGNVPPARFWTLGLYDPAGYAIPNRANRYGLSSSEMIHEAGQPWRVRLNPEPRPGNWLPTPGTGPFTLVLRAYESSGLSQLPGQTGETLPAIRRGDCR